MSYYEKKNEYKDTEAYRILMGVNVVYKEMVKGKMLLGRDIVTSDNEGNIRIEPARDYYERVYK